MNTLGIYWKYFRSEKLFFCILIFLIYVTFALGNLISSNNLDHVALTFAKALLYVFGGISLLMLWIPLNTNNIQAKYTANVAADAFFKEYIEPAAQEICKAYSKSLVPKAQSYKLVRAIRIYVHIQQDEDLSELNRFLHGMCLAKGVDDIYAYAEYDYEEPDEYRTKKVILYQKDKETNEEKIIARMAMID